MPSAVADTKPSTMVGGDDVARPRLSKPLTYSGSLDKFTSNDLTPVIGREYLDLQVVDLLKAEDKVIQDLALTSESDLTPDLHIITNTISLPTRRRLPP
jgi:hypothetical protein